MASTLSVGGYKSLFACAELQSSNRAWLAYPVLLQEALDEAIFNRQKLRYEALSVFLQHLGVNTMRKEMEAQN